MKPVLFLLWCIPFLSQAQLTDNFSDGNFTANPTWAGDDSQFTINASQQLQLNATAAGTSYLAVTTSMPTLDNAEWQFYIKLNFAPSSSNFARVYLVSNQANLKGSLNGYYLQFGETGSNDAIELFKQTGSTSVSVARGTNGFIASAFTITVKITRDNSGLWSIYADQAAGNNFVLQSSGTDATYNSGSYFGVAATYTSSNISNFYWDDFSIPNIADLVPPTIANVIATNNNSLDITFSEPVDEPTAELITNYSVNTIGNPLSAQRDAVDYSIVHLSFGSNFQSGTTYNLTISNVKDLNNNSIAPSSNATFVWNAPAVVQPFDVLINEIYFEPIATAPLPNVEFVEIYNRSSHSINLNGWKLTDGSTSVAILPAITLLPDSFLIVCKSSDAPLLSAYGSVAGTAAFPSLNNDVGDDLKLLDNSGTVIDRVVFNDDYYNNSSKKNGGFTIERIDVDFTCDNKNNWRASEDANGGTPGKANSVKGIYSDTTAPQLLSAYPLTANTVQLTFSESPDAALALIPANYSIDNGIGQPASVSINDTKITLTLTTALQQGVVYMITVSASLADCPGNKIDGDRSIKVGLPETINTGNLLINEILFNPKSGGNDFVELYNNSDKILDLKYVKIATTDDSNNISTNYSITDNGYLLFPSEYIAITPDIESLLLFYPNAPAKRILKSSLPGFNDDKGVCVITDFAFNRFDQLNYNKKWHFPLIDDQNGVSLERISFNRITQDSTNWHSAAETAGFATPGYKNSQSSESNTTDELLIEPEIFSPDNDGFNDVISFFINLKEQGFMLNAKIYNDAGQLVRHLVKSRLLSPEDVFSWDGITDRSEKAPIGIYVLYAEAVNPNGKIKKFKKAFVLASKL
jgi:hypothetical protein